MRWGSGFAPTANLDFVTAKLVGILPAAAFKWAWESPGWMNGRPVLKGFCDQPPYLSPAVQEPIVTSPCASAISSLHLSCWRWASCLLWGLVTQDLTGTGNSQVTVNVWDCCLVCSISHHNANSEPSTQPKPSTQLPNYGDLRLQKQVCKNAGRKPPPHSPPCVPQTTCDKKVSGRHY